ncbi:uncharacterized protein LTR77_000921 [Saxophila tyrrhenica]|uniref:Uncharacterized protein n=1 Tax=Saxophila tyrrhenica TaxID=1690608 RepID=A0AAV9PP42_9PEZI|nr:hypothetical protein LTR77_000921 [Saxophila tyrrhenica]
MAFDRQLLFLAFMFGARQVAGLPLSAAKELAPGIPAVVSSAPSDLDGLIQFTQPRSSYDGETAWWSAEDHANSIKHPVEPDKNGDSASSTALPRSEKPDPKGPSSSPTSVKQHGAVRARSLSHATRSLSNSTSSRLHSSSDGKINSSSSLYASSSSSAMASSLSASSALASSSADFLGLASSSSSQFVDSSSFSSGFLSTSVSVSASASPATTTGDALDVLESALQTAVPSSLRAPLESIFGPGLFPDSSSETPTTTTRQTRTDRTSQTTDATSRTTDHRRPTDRPRPTDEPTRRPHNRPPPPPTTRSTSSPTTTPTSLPTTLSTSTTPSTTSTPNVSPAFDPTDPTDPRNPANLGANPIESASVIGIATGLSASAVLVGLGGIFLWRRKSQGKPMFRRSMSQNPAGGPYPQVAWLYDPVVSRPGSPEQGQGGHMRGESGANLVPAAAAPAGRERSGSEVAEQSPSLRPVRPSSPLLMPEIRIEDDGGVYRGRGESGSYDNWRAASRGMRDDDQGA